MADLRHGKGELFIKKYKNLIGGTLVEPAQKKYFENLNPADHTDVIGLFPNSSKKLKNF